MLDTIPASSVTNAIGLRPPIDVQLVIEAPGRDEAGRASVHCKPNPPFAISSREMYASPRSQPSRCAFAAVAGQSPGTPVDGAGAGACVKATVVILPTARAIERVRVNPGV